ncbi:unnamed protein product [Lota lota]
MFLQCATDLPMFKPNNISVDANTLARVRAEENDGPLTMLIEETEQEPQSGPDETSTDISAGVINWLAVKAVTVDAPHQDVYVFSSSWAQHKLPSKTRWKGYVRRTS